MKRSILIGKRSTSITVAGLALGSLLLAGSPAAAQIVNAPIVNAPYVDQQQVTQPQPIPPVVDPGVVTPGPTHHQNHGGWTGHTDPAWGGNTNDPRFDRREAYQQQRIHQGIDSGSLNRGETRYLEREQGRIERAEERMLADGRLSPWERQRLNQMQNQAGRDIYRMEHNNRTADGWGGNNYNGWSGHSNSGWGGNPERRVDRREAYQQDRIQQGIADGSLTRGETRYLEREQGRIERAEQRMLADGRLSPWERQRLNQMQNQASRDIYRMENNNRTTAGYNGNQAGWQGNNHGWQGNNPVATGHYPGGNGYSHGGQAGWQGNHPGSGTTTGGTTTTGTNTTGGTTTTGTTTAGTTHGWQGNYARSGQPGAYQQAGARPGQAGNWQGQQQYQRPFAQGAQPQMRPTQPAPMQGQQFQQARMQAPQPQMRPNFNMAPRPQLGGMVSRANFSGGAPRRR